MWWRALSSIFVSKDTSTTEIYTYLHTLSLHDALPISQEVAARIARTAIIIAIGLFIAVEGVGAGQIKRRSHGAEALVRRNALRRCYRFKRVSSLTFLTHLTAALSTLRERFRRERRNIQTARQPDAPRTEEHTTELKSIKRRP